MNQIENLLSVLAERERLLREAQTAERHATTLTQAMDLIYGCADLETGIADALGICQEATGADLWMLLRRSGGMVSTLVCGPVQMEPQPWSDAGDVLATTRRVSELSEVPWFDTLPPELRAFRGFLSVPVEVPCEPPMVIALASRCPSAFSRFDQELMLRVAKLLGQAADNRRLAHRNAVLARVVDSSPVEAATASAFLDTSFEALSRAYARVAEWQGQVVDITNELLSAPTSQAGVAINRALARTGALAQVDRTYVFRVRGGDRIDNTHEWVASGIEPMIAHLQDMPVSIMDEWRPDLAARRAVHIPDVEALPDTSAVRDVLRMQGIQSLLAVPMLRDGRIAGFMGYDAVRAHRHFLPVEVQLLHAVANAINVVLDRLAAESETESARSSLQSERDRLQATLAAIPDLVLELDRDGRFSGYVPGSGLRALHDPMTLAGRTVEELLPTEQAALARSVMQVVDRDGRAEGYEYQMVVDGSPRWFLLSAAPRLIHGAPAGYVFVIRDITTRVAERRQLQRLGKIAELTSNLVVVQDAEQRIEWANPAFERRTGWPLEEIRGRPSRTLVPGESNGKALARIEAARKADQPVQVEIVTRTRNGERFWVRQDIQPLFDENGELEGFVSVQTDITDLKRSHQQAIRDRAVALDASTDGIAITNAEGCYVYMNVAHRRMFGIGDNEDVRKLNWRDLLPPDVATRFMAEDWSALEAEGAWRGELAGMHRDGSLVPQEVSLTLRDGGILCITRDISERLRLRKVLQERAVALDASRDGIALTGDDGHYVYMNTAHRRMFGIGDDEDLSKLHWRALYTPETAARFMEKEWHKLQTDGAWRGELHGVHRDGRPVLQEVTLSLRDSGTVCITREISERLELEVERTRLREDLQLAQRREVIAHLASGVAHDLNNLVSVVAGSASLLRDRCAEDDEAMAGLNRILRAMDTAQDLVVGMSELGRQRKERATHDLRALIEEGIELLGTRRMYDHAVSVLAPDHACPVWGNRTELLQVIVNLALNACDATADRNNRVSLTVLEDMPLPNRAPDAGTLSAGRARVAFTVTDTAAGMDEQTRARVFDLHFSTKPGSGNGLGLPIVAGILRDNDGALWIDSTPGCGTTMTVVWPSQPPEAIGTQAPQTATSGPVDLTGHNVLVVDDLPDVADVLSEMLEVAGAIGVAVSDPQEALDLLRENPGVWSALVTDYAMPTLRGTELARAARACVPPLPVILVTALPEAVGADATLFHAVLQKPVKASQLTDTVLSAVSARRSGKTARADSSRP